VVGRQFFMSRISIDAAAGVSLGFPVSRSGGIPSYSNDALIGTDQQIISQPQINILFQTGLYYSINNRMGILLKPNLKYNIANFYNDENYTIDRRYLSIGIKAGIVIDL